jgi:hypothetical protein
MSDGLKRIWKKTIMEVPYKNVRGKTEINHRISSMKEGVSGKK